MLRRSFLKRAAFVAAASGFFDLSTIKLVSNSDPTYTYVQYAIGYRVSKELMENDIYSVEGQLGALRRLPKWQ